MLVSVATKYARVLADLASELQHEDQVRRALVAFGRLLRTHEELRETLVNPAIPFSAKRKIVEKLAEKIPLERIVVNFVLVLLENARIHQFDQMAEAYQMVLDERRGILRGDVFSGMELEEEVKRCLERTASSLTGKEVRLNYRLDDSLIGGIKMKIGSTVFDGSIRTQLDAIHRCLVNR